MCIICKEHGEFWQTPSNHLAGHGCQKCKTDKVISHNKLSTEIFIEKCKKLHGDKYNYSKVNYINNYTKVCIICPKHGEFWQKPTLHLQGCGCPICKESKLETEIREFLIIEKITFEEKKHFDWLGKQHIDFFIPEYNVGIECQGEGHFENVEYFGGINSFKKRLKLDENKNFMCKNKIKLYYYTSEKILKINKMLPNIYNNNIFTNKMELLQKIKG